MGDGRLDNQWKDCPECAKTTTRKWGPVMHIPSEGRTDIVKCWSCGHEEPRFTKEEKPAGAEQYNYLTEQWEPEKTD